MALDGGSNDRTCNLGDHVYAIVNKRCIVKGNNGAKWEEVQSECTENLIEDELIAQNGNRSLEVDTEV
jgi:hypothetical protein